MGARVAVVIPTFNRPRELGQAVRSVLSQVDVELEVVVVDDGDSRGDLGGILADDRVRVVVTARPGAGEAAARNAGLESVTAPWIAFCDDDDLWHPRKLATQLAAADRVGWMACGNASFWVTRAGRPVVCAVSPSVSADEILAQLRRRGGIPGGASGVLARSDLVRDAGGYRDLSIGADWDLWLRLADRAPVGVVPERVVAVRLHPRSVTADARRLRRAMDDVAALHTGSDGSLQVVPDVESHFRWYAQAASRAGQGRLAMAFQSDVAKHSRRARDWLLAVAMLAAPRTVSRVRALRRRRAIPADERRAIEEWIQDALRR
jgi:glycosyltransferase involved in cell wall biosynthesis